MEKEMRLIDANKCPCNTCRTQYCGDPRRCTSFMMWLRYGPAETAPAVHACWIKRFTCYSCSECGHQVTSADNYCPNCGAKMDKE